MHRLLCPTEDLACASPELSKAACDHLKVLRPKDGETIELFDGAGRWRHYRVRLAGGRAAFALTAASDVRALPRPETSLTLFACVTKGARWDWTIEKATELGVTRIVPVLSERTVVRVADGERAAKGARWRRIAEEAARQSDAKWIPEILAPVSFAESIPLVKATRCFVGALATPPPPMILAALSGANVRSDALSLYVGPEGDFTPEELAALTACATPVSFGSTILRAETAAIYGLGVLKAYRDVSAR